MSTTYAYCKTQPVEKPDYLALVGKAAMTIVVSMMLISYAPSALASSFAQDMGRTTKEFFTGVELDHPGAFVEVRTEQASSETKGSANLAVYNNDKKPAPKKRVYIN